MTRRTLYRTTDGSAFAYTRRRYDYLRTLDHTCWAHERDGLLVSTRSGAALARRVGDVFYDVESNVPLYYEGTSPRPVRSSEGPTLTTTRSPPFPPVLEVVE